MSETTESSEENYDALAAFYKASPHMREMGLALPPASFITSKGRFISYVPRTSLVVEFPVQEFQLNPLRLLQGGLLASFIDDTFGPLSYATAGKPVLTLNLTTNFIRGSQPGDLLTITARVVSRSPDSLFMEAEVRNQKGKLVATASSHGMIVHRKLK